MANRPPANYCELCGEKMFIDFTYSGMRNMIYTSGYPRRIMGFAHVSCFEDPPFAA